MSATIQEARLAAARAHLAAARPPRASGPGPSAATLRAGYLDVLKLCLCDLGGPSTVSVGALEDGSVMARELRGEEQLLRSAGMDWPLQGHTMVGLGRLDDLQALVETVVRDGIEGDLIEAGTWRGGAAMLMRATLDTLGDERAVWVADSFQGFPAAEAAPGQPADLSAYDFLAAPEDEVRAGFARFGLERGVRFISGFFEHTLAGLVGERWAIVRLDADNHEPTLRALGCLYGGLAPGGFLVVDDYGTIDGCRAAVDEFRAAHDIAEEIEMVDHTCARWRKEREVALAPLAAADAPPPRAVERPRHRHVPTLRELELERELAAARERLAALERAPRPGARRWRAAVARRLAERGGAR